MKTSFLLCDISKSKFAGKPLEYDMNRRIPLPDSQFCFLLCFNLIFVKSPNLNSNLNNFIWNTHSHSAQEHVSMKEFCIDEYFFCSLRVVFQGEKWAINVAASSAFISIQTKSFLSAQRQMSLQKRKFSPYLENTVIISVVLETSCYQDTLAMNL